MKKYLGTLLLLAVLAAAGYILLSPKRQIAPDFALPNLQGQTVNHITLQGKVTLINFWFPSCPGCIKPKCPNPPSALHRALRHTRPNPAGLPSHRRCISFLMDKNGQIAKTHVGEPNFAEVYRLAEQPAPIFSGSLPPKKSYLKNKLPINQ